MAQAEMQGRDLDAVAKALISTRPTAHDLKFAVEKMLGNRGSGVEAAMKFSNSIVEKGRLIGEQGKPLIGENFTIMTHCNAGALATVDYGTALAPIKAAKAKNIRVIVSETRPRLQGAKLTAWEMMQEGIEHYIITDGASGYLMHEGEIDIIIVGADRIAANGDFANKIGTYEKAVIARENGVPFYAAAPLSTFDFSISSGNEIPIELRDESEVLMIGKTGISPMGSRALNPAFDVTPADYVTGIITEYGVFDPKKISDLKNKKS